jgi:hypothetical protein
MLKTSCLNHSTRLKDFLISIIQVPINIYLIDNLGTALVIINNNKTMTIVEIITPNKSSSMMKTMRISNSYFKHIKS